MPEPGLDREWIILKIVDAIEPGVIRSVRGGDSIAFDGADLIEATGKLETEESDPGIKIDSAAPIAAADRLCHQIFDEEPVSLKE